MYAKSRLVEFLYLLLNLLCTHWNSQSAADRKRQMSMSQMKKFFCFPACQMNLLNYVYIIGQLGCKRTGQLLVSILQDSILQLHDCIVSCNIPSKIVANVGRPIWCEHLTSQDCMSDQAPTAYNIIPSNSDPEYRVKHWHILVFTSTGCPKKCQMTDTPTRCKVQMGSQETYIQYI